MKLVHSSSVDEAASVTISDGKCITWNKASRYHLYASLGLVAMWSHAFLILKVDVFSYSHVHQCRRALSFKVGVIILSTFKYM